jgi:hypothetical protein
MKMPTASAPKACAVGIERFCPPVSEALLDSVMPQLLGGFVIQEESFFNPSRSFKLKRFLRNDTPPVI